MTEMRLDHTSVQRILRHIVDQAGTVVLGKETQIKLSLACILAGGHLLIEDIPGVGKTTLSHLLARLLGLDFNRIQFTSDLLPSDIVGASIYDKNTGRFEFQPGPVFCNVLLADEINRATPKAQSALLEAMEEGQVTVDGETRELPQPFFVIATQNPNQQIGTFPLPESQLDRFMMCVELGYPTREAEREILKGKNRKQFSYDFTASLSTEQLASIRATIINLHASDALLDYLQAIIEFTRNQAEFGYGLSPRGGIAFLHCAKAWAYLSGRLHVLPEDLQTVLPSILKHRLGMQDPSDNSDFDAFEAVIKNVPVP